MGTYSNQMMPYRISTKSLFVPHVTSNCVAKSKYNRHSEKGKKVFMYEILVKVLLRHETSRIQRV